MHKKLYKQENELK